MPILIRLEEIPPQEPFVRTEIARMRAVLSCQGQIEPIVFDAGMELGHYNWYDPAIVEAARELGWVDVLCTWPGEGRADR